MVMQMRNPKKPPIKAEMSSKLGRAMASTTETTTTSNLKKTCNNRVRNLDRLNRFGWSKAARGSIFTNTSNVDTIGAALQFPHQQRVAREDRDSEAYWRGNLVNGKTATRTRTSSFKASG